MSKKAVIAAIMRNNTFLLTGHVNPDGDSIACQLALAEALEQLGKVVSMQSADAVPAMYRQLPGASRIRRVEEIEGQFEAAILLECPTPQRSGFEQIPSRTIVNIDHHPDNQKHAEVNWVNPKAAATAEMIYSLVQDLGCEVTGSMAENLFAGLLTDTGSFTFSNTTAHSLEIAAQLMRRGADPSIVSQKVYRSYPPEKLDLIGFLLSGMRRYIGGEVAVMTINFSEIEKRGFTPEVFEDIVNLPLIASTVMVSAFGREDESGQWRFSVRSKGDVDVGRIAREFGGGGHRNAAGFHREGDVEEILKEMISKLITQIDSLKEAPE